MNKLKTSLFLRPFDNVAFLLPLLFILLTLVTRIWWLAIAESAALVLYIIYRLIFQKRYHEQMYNYLQSMTEYLDEASRENLTTFPMPITLLDAKGNVIWYNDLFYDLLCEHHEPTLFGQNISRISEAIRLDRLAGGNRRFNINYLGKYYTVYCMRQGKEEQKESFFALYWMDDDKLKRENIRLKSEKLCFAYVMLDSYDEIPSDVSEMQRANFASRVDVKVRNMARSVEGIIKKMEVDKYLLIFERRQLPKLEKNKFHILEEVKEITVGDGVHATLSIGISRAEGSLKLIDRSARAALDMALSRGGDQVALTNGEKYTFFGGKAQTAEKRKRVKVRIISEALASQITSSENVLIMGHKFADLDCMGAALALAHCVNNLAVPVHVVINPKENLVGDLMESVSKIAEYTDMFVDPARALKLMHEDTLLIIVDTHSVEYIESERLYKQAGRIALIDHHRKVTHGAIENTLIRFHEPNASSCCEMVTELIDNLPDCRIGKTEANALMAGIILDTKNFSERTGVRTFEAAAYLKSKGADTGEVQNFFKSDIATYKKQLEIISSAESYGDNMMISVFDKPAFDGMKIIAAKAADKLLSVKGIEASFVIYRENEQIHISARSEGEINVQTILEQMGGGGHRNAAGAQISAPMDEVVDTLRGLLDKENKNTSEYRKD